MSVLHARIAREDRVHNPSLRYDDTPCEPLIGPERI